MSMFSLCFNLPTLVASSGWEVFVNLNLSVTLFSNVIICLVVLELIWALKLVKIVWVVIGNWNELK